MDVKEKFVKRQKRIRKKIFNPLRVRLSVFRSNKHIYGQIIDDQKGISLVSSSDLKIDKKSVAAHKKSEIAQLVGEEIAKKALKKKIKSVVFDRGGYKYHGRVKALAEGARKGGLIF